MAVPLTVMAPLLPVMWKDYAAVHEANLLGARLGHSPEQCCFEDEPTRPGKPAARLRAAGVPVALSHQDGGTGPCR
jgi:hypothetical protein